MPNDAKFGLIIGVGLVIAVAVLFFQSQPQLTQPAAAEVQAPQTPPSAAALSAPESPPARPSRETKGQMTSHVQE